MVASPWDAAVEEKVREEPFGRDEIEQAGIGVARERRPELVGPVDVVARVRLREARRLIPQSAEDLGDGVVLVEVGEFCDRVIPAGVDFVR